MKAKLRLLKHRLLLSRTPSIAGVASALAVIALTSDMTYAYITGDTFTRFGEWGIVITGIGVVALGLLTYQNNHHVNKEELAEIADHDLAADTAIRAINLLALESTSFKATYCAVKIADKLAKANIKSS